VTASRHTDADVGWVLLGDAIGRHIPPTDKVHHVSGCRMSNGQSRLRRGSPADLAGKSHCKNCESVLARGGSDRRARR
jgi:hypothetical protein